MEVREHTVRHVSNYWNEYDQSIIFLTKRGHSIVIILGMIKKKELKSQ